MARDGRHRAPARPPGADAPDSDVDLFLAEVADVTPLRDRDRIPPPRPSRGGARAHRAPPAPKPLTLERDGEHAWAAAAGVSATQLAELRAGRVEPEGKIDLHGLRADDAGERVEAFIRDAVASARRCVLVISGRGRKTGGISVVKEEVLERLTSGPAARHVRALCTARPQHGGTGALYVALRRR